MGLDISVNVLARQRQDYPEYSNEENKDFAALNKLLLHYGLPLHQEPETLFSDTMRRHRSSFSYSKIHYLRRAVAYQLNDETLTPAPKDPTKDKILSEEYYMLRSHIICHADHEGYYLPIDFPDVLFDTDEIKVRGGMVGSSYEVRRELIAVAPSLSITLNDGQLGDEQAKLIADEDEHEFEIERQVWLTLYETSAFSIEHGTAIVFH